MLELARRQNAVIKVSGACTLSREPYPFPDIWDPLARVFDAWGFDRCLWGTDWTRAFAVVNYEQAVEPFLKTDRLSDSERAMLMGGALRQGLWLVAEQSLGLFTPPDCGTGKIERATAFCDGPDTLGGLRRIGIRRVSHAAASDPFTPVGNDAKGGHACHSRLAAKEYIFTAYAKR